MPRAWNRSLAKIRADYYKGYDGLQKPLREGPIDRLWASLIQTLSEHRFGNAVTPEVALGLKLLLEDPNSFARPPRDPRPYLSSKRRTFSMLSARAWIVKQSLMSPDVKKGLALLLDLDFPRKPRLPSSSKRRAILMEAARNWILQQMVIDDRRRKPRGAYKRNRS